MSTAERFFSAIREVMVLSEKVQMLTRDVATLQADQKAMDRRLARMEGQVDLVQALSGRRALPSSGNDCS